ncbi:flagellar type III secretion system pore protein FliP [Halanaerobiaceae bacterium Z-7014]|uniref:Flagellar biosynthetic protein FliP n=1 Tax=Halonatronomonas betaini TaxID=2778430 RepID=A0A931AVS2_9FIRM|nr:flagellar type III secretion system pore protein FliP [Halonatronomonas betaini]MBF8435698.1 flagellar type III secretion system pore protein FliP [Halonatronomonas betaini]
MSRFKFYKGATFLILVFLIVMLLPAPAMAQEGLIPNINLEIGAEEDGDNLVPSLQLLLLLTILSLAPAILIMVTSFTRIIIVLSMIRNALATRTMPPNQVLIGLAIFLTIFIMAPVWQGVIDDAVTPYINEEIETEEMVENGLEPIRGFMFEHVRERDLSLFYNMTDMERPQNQDDVPIYLLIPAFILSELKVAFQIGFIIYIPFVMIDMVVASILMSMGMLMLPPVMISLPFKIMLFVLVDGWYLIIESLIRTF